MIKNIGKYGSALLLGALLTVACEQEDALEPSHADEIYFWVPDDATDEVSQLRRDFVNETGIHLLFNDTLRKTYVGKDGFGQDVYDVEAIDFNYLMNNNTLDNTYRFTYFDELSEMEDAADFAREWILPHMDGTLKPYSLLLLSKLEIYEWVRSLRVYDWVSYNYFEGWRCLALSLGGISDTDDAGRKALMLDILGTVVGKAVYNLPYDTKTEFYAFSYDYYGADKEYDLGLSGEYNDDEARGYGFLYDTTGWYYPYEEEDIKTYVREAMARTPEEFEEAFGSYPLVMAKYEVIVRMMESVGYKF